MSSNLVRPTKSLNTRRSQRLLLKISVVVTGQKLNGSSFFEHAGTEIVNAHGALLHLREAVLQDQHLRIQNNKTGEEQPCKVISVGQKTDGKAEVAIEFLEPAPRCWRIAFPPEDWNVHSPEAKRLVKKTPSVHREPERKGPAGKS